MASSDLKLAGYLSRSTDMPRFNPNNLVIVGGPDAMDLSGELAGAGKPYWALYCPRAAEIPEEEFIESVRNPNRVFETIHAIKDGDGDSARILVVAHRRCVKAARRIWDEQEKAGVPVEMRVMVRVQLHKGLTEEQIFDLNKDENGSKKPLTFTQKVMQISHYNNCVGSINQTAAKFRCSPQDVANKLKFMDLVPEVQALMESGVIAVSHAPTIAGLTRDKQVEAATAMVANGHTKGAVVAKVVKAVKEGKKLEAGSKVERMRSRAHIEKLAKESKTRAGDEVLDGELTPRDLLMLSMGLEWVTGKDSMAHKDLRALVEIARGGKKRGVDGAVEGF